MYYMKVRPGLVYVLFLVDIKCDIISLPAHSFLVQYLPIVILAAGV